MDYHGDNLEELATELLYINEPVVITQGFLVTGDIEKLHGWIFEPVWPFTQVLTWGPGSVSSQTFVYQRLLPPPDWEPQERPVPEPEPEEPVEGESPVDEEPPAETPEVPPEGENDEHTS
ncbi:hypothetical protein D3C87_1184830 [compost metagenome]